ncbi:MAG: HAMP domain-containing sensor histidine kinase [Gordonia paraffinivorans]
MTDRADRAPSLLAEGYQGQDLVTALQGDAIRVRLRTVDGTVYQTPGPVLDDPGQMRPPRPSGGRGPRGDDSGPPPGGPDGRGPGAVAPGAPGDALVVTRALPDGSTVTLLGDTTSITQVRHQLRWLMLAAGLVALAVATGLILLVVRRALRPLEAMVDVARDITSGDRGRRVRPASPSTELGRTAESMDEMLDALEAAETSERTAAETARLAEADIKRFLADAAHELRTPIAGLSAVAESIARDGADRPDRVARWSDLLVRESRHASRLVDDLLDMARIDDDPALDLVDADLATIVDGAVERAGLVHPALVISRHGPASVPVRVDPGRIGQVVTNLLENAARVSAPGGAIDVDLSVDGTTATVAVTDDGPGVDAADRDRIFDRLVRLDRARDTPGAGLGLPIARALARAHGGDVSCRVPATGTSRTGAQFVVSIPLRTGPILEPGDSVAPTP